MTEQSCILVKKNDDFPILNSINFPDLFNKKLTKVGDWTKDIYLPLSVFNNPSLSTLETITKYIKEEIGLNYREIGFLLNRNERTIWGAYYSSRKKMQQRLLAEYSKFYVPISIFENRSLSVLEALAEYLKEELNLRYCQIASFLNRDDRTIWTVYHRAKKKRKKDLPFSLFMSEKNLKFIQDEKTT